MALAVILSFQPACALTEARHTEQLKLKQALTNADAGKGLEDHGCTWNTEK